MKEEVKKIFRCDYCKKIGFMKNAMERHERFCMKNPQNLPMCFKGANGCKHFKNWNCSALNKDVCTDRYAHKWSRRLDGFNIIVMPKMCDRYEKAPTHEDYFLDGM